MTTLDARTNWISSLNWQIDFYRRAPQRKRLDREFDFRWFEQLDSRVPIVLRRVARAALRLRPSNSDTDWQEWINTNAHRLWETRRLLADKISQLLFDSMLVLVSTSYRQFYFPRLDFADLLSVIDDTPFMSTDLPNHYLGLPLRVLTLELRDDASQFRMVSTHEQVQSVNSYRQYLIQRDCVDFVPRRDDIVLDCGACIGDGAALFARLVGASGEVHTFDPIPLHSRFCALQARLNRELEHVFRVNTLAVGATSQNRKGQIADTTDISPAGLCIDSFSTTSLDHYVSNAGLKRVSMIKMDIEGSELEALEGARHTIHEFQPRLAISAYHKREHLWEIPERIKAHNDNYNILFGHHSPIAWESVYYAAPRRSHEYSGRENAKV